MYWRLGTQLPALLPDGEDALPLPLLAGTHLPDPAAPDCPAACQRPPVQVPAAEECLQRPDCSMVFLRMPCVQHVTPTNLWGHITLPRRAPGPSLERQLGYSDPKVLENKNREDKHAGQSFKDVFVSHQQKPQQAGLPGSRRNSSD